MNAHNCTDPAAQPLRNTRHEAFAVKVAEPQSQSEAYRRLYPRAARWGAKALHEASSKLAARPEVAARIAHLQARARALLLFGLGMHLARLNVLSLAAERAGDFGAAVMAEERRGRAAGFYSTRAEVTGRRGAPIATEHARDLTGAELQAELLRHGIGAGAAQCQ